MPVPTSFFSAIHQRDALCSPGEGLCSFGIKNILRDNAVPTMYNLTAYSGDCKTAGSTMTVNAEANSFLSYDSGLPFTVETRSVDSNNGGGTAFMYAGLEFGGMKNGLKKNCGGCRYPFVGPGCSPNWDKATCKVVRVADEAVDQDIRWKSVDTEGAWAAAIADWNAQNNRGGLTFSAQISNFFKGPPQFNCEDTSNGSGCR
jgi:hypothetical protein